MSENKFTPGPWVVRKWDSDKWPEKRVSIASKYNDEALFINARYAKDVEGNANLIAAAPELLEVLESMRNFMEWRYGEEDPFVMDANKAIAKAKGEL